MYIIYSKDNCPRCVTAKQLLERKGIEYEVKMADVDYDVNDLRELGVRLMPYITYEGRYVARENRVVGGLEELMKELF